ncbi:tetratricopeptide repeat protein [Phenylobacterium kunshanense]|nr:tetratricopeptide repeat protein [Phenylobacterium kunshanense]
MADDGGWPIGAGPESWESGDARTRVAIDQLRVVFSQAERRLADDRATVVLGDTLVPLIHSLDDLARRLTALEVGSERVASERRAAPEQVARRPEAQPGIEAAREAAMSARLDLMLEQLGRARAAAEAGTVRQTPSSARTVMVAASAVAALGVVGAGAMLVIDPALASRLLPPVAERLQSRPDQEPRAAVGGEASSGPVAPQPQDSYVAVSDALARGEASALPRLASLAEAGDTQAQLHLASLHETGQGGLPQDLAAARQWTVRAAQAGDRFAQHNLALFLMQGEGGVRDVADAAHWFRKAAEQGVLDSQYNLGLLYESGRGVDRNLPEAYRWFARAAEAGDPAARQKQLAVARQLGATERAALGIPAPSAPSGPGRGDELATLVIAPATTVAETQALLARHGYYAGPMDGVASPAFRAAADAYLRDRGILR